MFDSISDCRLVLLYLYSNGWSHYDYSHGGEEDYFSGIRSASRYGYNIALTYSTTKQYNIELKPLFAAFHWRNLALTSLRSFSLFYSSLMNYQLRMELDAGRDLPRTSIDWIVPLKYSVAQIMREVTLFICCIDSIYLSTSIICIILVKFQQYTLVYMRRSVLLL